jgi:hypothetical protein
MTIQSQTFQMAEIANAIGASPQTIKAWLHKGIVLGNREITGGGGAGNRRNFTFHNLMEFAVAKAIMEIGFQRDAETAFKAAAGFAHVGHESTDGLHAERLPGFPFYEGFTLLCTSGEHTTVVQHDPGSDQLTNIRINLRRPMGFLVIDMSEVFERTVSALGYHPQEQIDLAYKAN